ncbi:MAG: FxDxF family PEP-CTERM protein [Bacteroidia bacterium]|nr:FxDxF family PEP-CTERM protein [Methylotenera sp.]
MGTLHNAQAAVSGIKITEWMYNPVGSVGEFVEFTNFSSTSLDLTGWSFDDNTRLPGSDSLSLFGSVAAGESVIITEADANAFRTNWSLNSTVKVIGGISNNLGRSDEINLYNNTGALIDRLTFNDQGAGSVKSPRTQGVSSEAGSLSILGANNASLWVLSSVGDKEGSYTSIGGDIGSPGLTSFATVAAVPEPSTYAMLLAGLGFIGFTGRRRKL